MSELYEPASEFLKSVIVEKLPLGGSAEADANLRRLISLTRDENVSNRDWATMLLAQSDVETPEVHAALLIAAGDDDLVVRSEAILGIARRDPHVALPLLIGALDGDEAVMPLFEAATVLADPTLIDCLRPWSDPSDKPWLDKLVQKALDACDGRREDQD
jgi:HEAT repeat protein